MSGYVGGSGEEREWVAAQEEAERRLASAKRGAVPEAGPPAKRRRPGHEFDEVPLPAPPPSYPPPPLPPIPRPPADLLCLTHSQSCPFRIKSS